jgi:hypothetical protein
MSEAGTQEVEVTVEGVITRLMPCPLHASRATGRMETSHGSLEVGTDLPEGCQVHQNPNGFNHHCPQCAQTPTQAEELERTVTRHVL